MDDHEWEEQKDRAAGIALAQADDPDGIEETNQWISAWLRRQQ